MHTGSRNPELKERPKSSRNPELKERPKMIEIKFLGKGGQGVVVASELLAQACFEKGMYAQCFSLFGGERRGAPVASFVRIDHQKIYLKCDIDHPNHFILFDESLFNEKEIMEQVRPGGTLLLNMKGSYRSDALNDALEISKKNGLESIVNTAILGAYIRLTQIISLGSLLKVIKGNVPAAIDQNLMAAKEAYEKLSLA
jgi:2-oxoacid:acceptor oxidoreductase gamma subunit (pyruvate/2-ketoisovalerate family)